MCEITALDDCQCTVFDKTNMWLRRGVLVVVETYPAERTVLVHRRGVPFETLTGGGALPGFSLPLSEIFDV